MTRQTSILIRIYATPEEAQLIEDTLDTRARTEALLGAIPQEDSTMGRKQYTQDDITDHVGADNWKMVVDEFGGKSLAEVRRTLDEMYHTEDNAALAEAIVKQIK